MRKSSRSISLALIGSALLIGGCQPAIEEPESDWGPTTDEVAQGEPGVTAEGIATGNDQYNSTHHSGGGRTASRIGGAIIGSQIGRAIGGGSSVAPRPGYGGGGYAGGSAPAAPSARGGFGSSAGHSSASS